MAKDSKIKGVYEKVSGSGVWWIRYADQNGKIRREKAGTKGAATKLYQKRKTEVLQGKKLPETLRARTFTFSELVDDATAYCRANNQGQQFDLYRLGRLKEAFGNRPGEISIEDLRKWFSEQEWEPATHNRYKSTLSLLYRLATENGKVATNPARLLKRKHEDNGRIRFLGQFLPQPTELEYLRVVSEEESRLRAVIAKEYSAHMPEFIIALHTGLRPSEQYKLTWDRVDLARKMITIPKSKNGSTRHIPLNTAAADAFQQLFSRSAGQCPASSILSGRRQLDFPILCERYQQQ